MAFSRRLVLPVMLLLAYPALADGTPVSPERARAALAAGKIRPLARLLSTIEQRYAGQVIEAELHEEGELWVYEFEVLPADGRLFAVELDAASGNLLRTRGPVTERR